MRVLLAGRPEDRDRLRPDLIEAGFEIVAEASEVPPPGAVSPELDAIVVAPNAARALAGNARDRLEVVEPLTPRELEVLVLVAEGLPNKAIAASLGISDQTVKFHVAAIIAKLGATNRTEAVRQAIRRGLLAI